MAFGKRNTQSAAAGFPAPAVFGKLRQPAAAGPRAITIPAAQTHPVAVADAALPTQAAGQGKEVHETHGEEWPGFKTSIDTTLIAQASGELLVAMMEAYGDEQGCHLETLMAAFGALAGEFCLRAGAEAAGRDLPHDEQFILADLADPYIWGDERAESIHLWGMIAAEAIDAGASPELLPDPRAVVERAVEAIRTGQAYPPRPQIPERNLPLEWSPNACPRHRKTVQGVMARCGIFASDEIAMAIGIAMMRVLQAAKENFAAGTVSPETLATLALETMVAVSRMAPLETMIE